MRGERKGAGRPPADKEIIALPEEIQFTPYQEVLEQAAISEKTAFVWQKVARVPEDKFEVYFTEADYYKDEFTIAGLLKFAGERYGRSDSAEWQG